MKATKTFSISFALAAGMTGALAQSQPAPIAEFDKQQSAFAVGAGLEVAAWETIFMGYLVSEDGDPAELAKLIGDTALRVNSPEAAERLTALARAITAGEVGPEESLEEIEAIQVMVFDACDDEEAWFFLAGTAFASAKMGLCYAADGVATPEEGSELLVRGLGILADILPFAEELGVSPEAIELMASMTSEGWDKAALDATNHSMFSDAFDALAEIILSK